MCSTSSLHIVSAFEAFTVWSPSPLTIRRAKTKDAQAHGEGFGMSLLDDNEVVLPTGLCGKPILLSSSL